MAAPTNTGDEMLTGINVTPLVDITLVLLIVFMVTAKLIASPSMPLDLPKAANAAEQQVVFSVALGAGGERTVDGSAIGSDDELLAHARIAHAKASEVRAVIQADARVQHGAVVHAMDLLKQGGIDKIAFGVVPDARAAAAR
jgi:biopolymer transport protein ExbD